ncbi:MAG TPA: sugar ABC transporter permease [Tepidisphaeraceae bacterium]|nr:sugar ABC transporter permease [Tepidisphaeraceae bacterium]
MTRTDARQLGKGLAFVSPWLVGFLLFMLLPIVLSFYYSLCDYTLLQPPLFVGLENYRDLVHDPIFWQSLGNTLYFAALTIPSALFLSLGLAMLLNVKMPGQAIFRTIIFLPSLMPIVASAMVWMWIFNGKIGLLNNLLSKIGVSGPDWLGSSTWTMPALALMSLWGVGYTVVIYLAGLQDVPRELYEAAQIDGAGLWSRLWNVTLPILSPVIFFNLVMSIIGVLQVFDIPYIMTPNGGQGRSTEFIAMYLNDNAFRFLKMGYASAIAWIMLLIILVLTGLAFWSSKRWVHYQGK